MWCYQLLTFTLLFSGSVTPEIVQVRDTDPDPRLRPSSLTTPTDQSKQSWERRFQGCPLWGRSAERPAEGAPDSRSFPLQVTSDLVFPALTDDTFDRQITRELILEDTLHFLLNSHTHLPLRAEQVGHYPHTHTRTRT